jgi:hypothetical protein
MICFVFGFETGANIANFSLSITLLCTQPGSR